MPAAVPFTAPSMILLSVQTSVRVRYWPGRMNTASLTASPYRSLRAATVSAETWVGATSGTSRIAYCRQPMTTPTATTVRVRAIMTGVGSPPSASSKPTTGASHSSMLPT